MKLRVRLVRAQEEIDRLNVEVRRLHTAIRDEAILFDKVLADLSTADSPLLGATSAYISRRKTTNHVLLTRIHQVYSLKGFTGVPKTGRRISNTANVDAQHNDAFDGLLVMPELPDPLLPMHQKLDDDDNALEDGALEEEEELEMDGLVQFISELAL
jgi:hypothetical protein